MKRRYLQQVEVFQDLSETQIYEVERSTRMSTVGPGRILHQPDEKSEMLFLLKSGRVQIYRISPDGKRFIVSNIEPGMFFGEMALLGQAMHDSFAEAVTDSTVCVISRRDLEYLIGRFPTIGVRIMQALADRLSEAESQLEDLALKSLTARLATLILRLSSGANGRVAGLTHNDLAERVGTSRETATQALNELKNAGLIAIGRKRIDVLDRQGLEDVAEAY
ncbi:MAG: Crp/Fnr family transcriptional regulator [Chloroflexi bacterium]|nr:Crp/Fnr family transcriptional regulator [Chloroflexota bacterium]